MALIYKTAKWDKQKKNYEKIGAMKNNYKNIDTITKLYLCPEEVISKSKSKFVRPITDRMCVYYQLGNSYHSLYETAYMFEDNKLCIESLYRYFVYTSEAYNNFNGKAGNLGIVRDIMLGKNFNHLMCTAILFDEYERIKEHADFSKIFDAIYRDEDEKAKEIVDKLPDNVNDNKEVYYIKSACLKNIFFALLDGDEKLLKKELEERVKKLRRNTGGYLTVLDVISLAVIKIARGRGMSVELNLIEIPLDFIEKTAQLNKNDIEIDLFR